MDFWGVSPPLSKLNYNDVLLLWLIGLLFAANTIFCELSAEKRKLDDAFEFLSIFSLILLILFSLYFNNYFSLLFLDLWLTSDVQFKQSYKNCWFYCIFQSNICPVFFGNVINLMFLFVIIASLITWVSLIKL